MLKTITERIQSKADVESPALRVLMLLATSTAAFAQAKSVPPESGGGAYYEFLMALHLESQGDTAGAAAAYQRAERLDPQSAEIPAALAELYARMNRPADAIAAGERAIKAGPSNPEANWITARVVECTFILVGILSVLGIITLTQQVAGANEGTVAYTLAGIKDWTFLLGPGWGRWGRATD